jgi:hypothetical protein
MINSLRKLKAIIYAKFASQYWKDWNYRINDAKRCSDNQFIPRVKNAGVLKGEFQLMHNGIKVKKDGYYGRGVTRMLSKNKGVHEPQEERVFQEVLKELPPKSVIIELGSYWAFYSMWFLSKITDGRAYLFEPDYNNLQIGKTNYAENKFEGDFNYAFIGSVLNLKATPPTLTIDHIVKDKQIDFIDILHCDIQGCELAMLDGAIEAIKKDIIKYLFISTHSNELHQSCLSFLIKHNYIVISEADITNSYSFDGLIVARSPNYEGIDVLEIAKKPIRKLK